MMFAFGPQPDPKVIEDRADDVSMEAAFGAWSAGYSDGRNERAYHVFPEDSQDLQPLYSDGFERGERDRLYAKRIEERLPKEPGDEASRSLAKLSEASEQLDDASGDSAARVAWRRTGREWLAIWRWLKETIDVLMFFAVLALAAALIWG